MSTRRYIAEQVLSHLKNSSVRQAAVLLRDQLIPVVPDADGFVDMGPLLEHYLISEAQWQPMESVGMLAGAPSGWHAVVRRGSDPYTQRYTLAHELGHWLLFHRCGIDSEEAKRLGLYHEVEELCDVFAALTLVTREAVQRLLEGQGTVTFATLATCARKAKVPIRAVLYRLATFPSGFRTSGRVLVFRADGISNKLVLAASMTILPEWICLPKESTAEGLGLRHLLEEWAGFTPGREYLLREDATLFEIPADEGSERAIATSTQVRYRLFRSADGVFIVGLLPDSDRSDLLGPTNT
jgi:hypothetical protein